MSPTRKPSKAPSKGPSREPTAFPSRKPTDAPSVQPTNTPTLSEWDRCEQSCAEKGRLCCQTSTALEELGCRLRANPNSLCIAIGATADPSASPTKNPTI